MYGLSRLLLVVAVAGAAGILLLATAGKVEARGGHGGGGGGHGSGGSAGGAGGVVSHDIPNEMKQVMSDAMQLRFHMLMDMQVDPDDPAAILALKDDLNLTEEQVGALEKLVAGGRGQAAEVLTPDQAHKLDPLAHTPNNARDFQRKIVEAMQAMAHKAPGGGPNKVSGQAVFGDLPKKMSEPMKKRFHMLVDIHVDKNDPAGVMALDDDLKLTKEQVQSLEKVLEKNADDAHAVLTAEQAKKLQPLAKTPDSLREFQRQLQGKAKPKASPTAAKKTPAAE